MKSRYCRRNAWKPDSFLAAVSLLAPWESQPGLRLGGTQPARRVDPEALGDLARLDPCDGQVGPHVSLRHASHDGERRRAPVPLIRVTAARSPQDASPAAEESLSAVDHGGYSCAFLLYARAGKPVAAVLGVLIVGTLSFVGTLALLPDVRPRRTAGHRRELIDLGPGPAACAHADVAAARRRPRRAGRDRRAEGPGRRRTERGLEAAEELGVASSAGVDGDQPRRALRRRRHAPATAPRRCTSSRRARPTATRR